MRQINNLDRGKGDVSTSYGGIDSARSHRSTQLTYVPVSDDEDLALVYRKTTFY